MAKRVQTRFKQRPTYFFKQWRKFRGLTQEQLAERIGVTPSTISQIETGKQGFTDATLEALAEELRCGPGDLLMRNPLDTEAPWSVWENISKERRPLALEVLKSFQNEEILRTREDGPLRVRLPSVEDGHSVATTGGDQGQRVERQRRAR